MDKIFERKCYCKFSLFCELGFPVTLVAITLAIFYFATAIGDKTFTLLVGIMSFPIIVSLGFIVALVGLGIAVVSKYSRKCGNHFPIGIVVNGSSATFLSLILLLLYWIYKNPPYLRF